MKAGTKLNVTITDENGIVLDQQGITLNNNTNILEICYTLPGLAGTNPLALETLQIGA
jgi:hypothetical protein